MSFFYSLFFRFLCIIKLDFWNNKFRSGGLLMNLLAQVFFFSPFPSKLFTKAFFLFFSSAHYKLRQFYFIVLFYCLRYIPSCMQHTNILYVCAHKIFLALVLNLINKIMWPLRLRFLRLVKFIFDIYWLALEEIYWAVLRLCLLDRSELFEDRAFDIVIRDLFVQGFNF